MATFTKEILNGSVNGRPIRVTGIGAAVTIHQAGAGVVNKDEVWIYANNTSAASVELTIAWGGTTSPDDYIIVSIPAKQGLVLIAPGLPLNNSLIVKAFASVVDVINISGFVNRITA